MGIVDVTKIGLDAGKQSFNNRNKAGQLIGTVERFADKLTVDKCYKFGEGAMGAIASSVSGECTTNIMDQLGSLLKNNALMKYFNKGIDMVNNTIDTVKSFGRSVVGFITNSKLGIKMRSFYCGILAPALQILIMAINAIIALPLSILNRLYNLIQKIRDISSSVTNKLFDCFNGFLDGMKDSLGKMDKIDLSFKLNDLFSFLDDVEGFLKNCEIISRPLIDTFNNMIQKCTPGSIRPVFDEIGMTSDSVDEPLLCSATDLIAFLERRRSIKTPNLDKVERILNSLDPFRGLFNGAKALSELTRSYVQNGIGKVYENTMAQLHRVEAWYNNLLATKSRTLGKIVNASIGWLFPDCGSSKFSDGVIKRRSYSILDVVNILDSMNGCNYYICGSLNNRVSELLAQLELSKYGKWINPLININTTINKMIDNLFVNTFGTDSEIANQELLNSNVDISFLQKNLPLSLTVKAVY